MKPSLVIAAILLASLLGVALAREGVKGASSPVPRGPPHLPLSRFSSNSYVVFPPFPPSSYDPPCLPLSYVACSRPNPLPLSVSHLVLKRARGDSFPNARVAKSFDPRDASAATVTITRSNSWSSTQYADWLCGNLTSGSFTSLKILADSSVSFAVDLPDCFYDHATSLTDIQLEYTSIRGNATYPSAMERLGLAMPAQYSFGWKYGQLLDAFGSFQSLDWVDMFNNMPTVQEIAFESCQIGTGLNLPANIPKRFAVFQVTNCGLGGSIPSLLLSQYDGTATKLYLSLNQNALSSSMPSSFFPPAFLSNLELLNVDLSQNQLTGSISNTLFAGPMPAMKDFSFDVGANGLTGNLDGFFANSNMFTDGVLTSVKMYFDTNALAGTLPLFFPNVGSNVTQFLMTASYNHLEGDFPSDYLSGPSFSSSLVSFTLSLYRNSLTGGIPASLLDFANIKVSPKIWDINLAQNELDGTIAPGLFAPMNWSLTTSAAFRFGDNALSGDIPDTLFNMNPSPNLVSVILDLSRLPNLVGTVPASFWLSLVTNQILSPTPVMRTVVLIFIGTPVSGALDFPDLSLSQQALSLNLLASNSNFSSISFAGTVPSTLSVLDLSNNTFLEGTLPTKLFDSSSTLTFFAAGYTKLSGEMPNMASFTSTIRTLSLRSTAIDFCSGSRAAWTTTLETCDLTNTTAAGCSALYPECQTAETVPGASPIESPHSSSPPPVPVSVPQPPIAVPCSASTRPSASFACIDGIWTSNTSVTTPTFTVPAGSTQTVIQGNLTTSEVIIQGFGSTILVTGCVSNLTTITVQLTTVEVETIGSVGKTQPLLIYNASDASCTSGFSNVGVATTVTGKTCKKVDVSKVTSTNTMSALFTVNNSKCNTWWIILVSVLCGVVVVGVVVTIVVIVVIKKAHLKSHQDRLQKAQVG